MATSRVSSIRAQFQKPQADDTQPDVVRLASKMRARSASTRSLASNVASRPQTFHKVMADDSFSSINIDASISSSNDVSLSERMMASWYLNDDDGDSDDERAMNIWIVDSSLSIGRTQLAVPSPPYIIYSPILSNDMQLDDPPRLETCLIYSRSTELHSQ